MRQERKLQTKTNKEIDNLKGIIKLKVTGILMEKYNDKTFKHTISSECRIHWKK